VTGQGVNTQNQDWLIAALDDFFAKTALTRVDVPILQPAEPFLDSVGEDLRRRIFMTENEHGDLLCLRPEFTIPVCLSHINQGQCLPHRYAYLGEVFRQRRSGGQNSFIQAGIEDLGDPDKSKADGASLTLAIGLVRSLLPTQKFQIVIGDHGVFDAVLAALELPTDWQRRLSGCFGDKTRLLGVLNDLSQPPPSLELPSHIDKALIAGDEPALILALETQMYEDGLPLHASRSAGEIAARLMARAALTRQPLGEDKRQILEQFLSIHVPLTQAVSKLEDFANKTQLHLEQALSIFAARCEALRNDTLLREEVYYDAAFGRLLDYYSGFIYEIRHETQILVGGGRYDHLLNLLGSSTPIPAVGFSLWLDRLEQFPKSVKRLT